MEALYSGETVFERSAIIANISARYLDIEELFLEEIAGSALPTSLTG